MIFTDKSKFPPDAAEGSWRLDVVKDESQTRLLMWHVMTFALQGEDPLHQLLIGGLLHDTDALDEFQKPAFEIPLSVDILAAAEAQALSPRQTQALFQTFQFRASLIQGPPGTGKTLTAKAIVSVHERLLDAVSLLTAVTRQPGLDGATFASTWNSKSMWRET
jgi:hypothetical protein